MRPRVIVDLSKEDRQNNHIPDWVFEMADKADVFIKDHKTKKYIQVLDLKDIQSREAKCV